MTTEKLDDSVLCWMCEKVIRSYPHSFHVVYDTTKKGKPPKAICGGCRDKFNKIVNRKMVPQK
jgi:predicted fused transcriptional regulator/phosphomethylpyrimidine kinase